MNRFESLGGAAAFIARHKAAAHSDGSACSTCDPPEDTAASTIAQRLTALETAIATDVENGVITGEEGVYLRMHFLAGTPRSRVEWMYVVDALSVLRIMNAVRKRCGG